MIDNAKDWPRRARHRVADALSRVAFRLRGQKAYDIGWGLAGNRAAELHDAIVIDLATAQVSDREELLERVGELARLAKAETCGLIPPNK